MDAPVLFVRNHPSGRVSTMYVDGTMVSNKESGRTLRYEWRWNPEKQTVLLKRADMRNWYPAHVVYKNAYVSMLAGTVLE